MMPFSDEDIYTAVMHHLPTVNEYVQSHGGGIKVLGVADGRVYIQLTGTCHGCSMSLMTTKMVVEKRLRELIHPNLEVINVEPGQESNLPDNLYREDAPQQEDEKSDTPGKRVMKKIKKLF
ncbi:NifU family protein [Hydrogenimonas urashimensis]|uniref:NifU family protein n=1 Tax=Hydrogenimonas urashimensis TaxID=2740515 RepID=UPI001F22A01D|nr:NifU family protein [Hydrogenimonas urashimensis]